MACLRDTLRDSAIIGVEQKRPILTPGVAKPACSEASARSQLATSWQPAALVGALYFRDHRPRMMHDRLHQRRAMRHQLGEVGLALILVAPPLGDFFEIVAGTEGWTCRRR